MQGQRHLPSHMRRQGFTLIEIIVVVAVIALIAAIAMPKLIMDKDRLASKHAARMLYLISHTRHQAVLDGRHLSIEFDIDASQVSLWVYGSHWKPLEDKQMGVHQLPNDIEVQFENFDSLDQDSEEESGQRQITLASEEEQESSVSEDVDQLEEEETVELATEQSILFSPYGEISNFRIEFIGDEKISILDVDDEGDLRVEQINTR